MRRETSCNKIQPVQKGFPSVPFGLPHWLHWSMSEIQDPVFLFQMFFSRFLKAGLSFFYNLVSMWWLSSYAWCCLSLIHDTNFQFLRLMVTVIFYISALLISLFVTFWFLIFSSRTYAGKWPSCFHHISSYMKDG